jgi:hypothetical protein
MGGRDYRERERGWGGELSYREECFGSGWGLGVTGRMPESTPFQNQSYMHMLASVRLRFSVPLSPPIAPQVLLSSGPYSYPAHRPVLAAWEGRAEGEDGREGKGAGRRGEAGKEEEERLNGGERGDAGKEEEERLNGGERGEGHGGGGAGGGGGRRGGRLVVLGAADMWTDAWLDQEDNGCLADVIFQVGARKAPEGEGEGKERGGGGCHHSRPLVLPRSQWLLHREPDAESSAPPSNLGQASFSHDRSPSRLAQLLFCGDARPEQERAHDPVLPPALPPSLQPRLCTPRVRDLAQQLRPCLQVGGGRGGK